MFPGSKDPTKFSCFSFSIAPCLLERTSRIDCSFSIPDTIKNMAATVPERPIPPLQ